MLHKYHSHNRHSYMMIQKQSWLLIDDDDLSDEFDVYGNTSSASQSSPYGSSYYKSSTPTFGDSQIFGRDSTSNPSLFARKPKPTSLYKRLSCSIKSTLHHSGYSDNSRKKKKKEKQSQDGKTNPME